MLEGVAMARIIEETQWTCERACSSCGTVQVLEEADVGYGDFGMQYADDHDWRFYFVCARAGCAEQNVLPDRDVPPHVQRLAGVGRG